MKTSYTSEEISAMSGDDLYRLAKNEMSIAGVSMMGDVDIRKEVLYWLVQNNRLDATNGPATDGDGPGTIPQAAVEPTVKISYVAYESDLPVVGQTLRRVLEQLRPAWGIVNNPLVFVDGQAVTDLDRRLTAGDRLEFVKPSGEKGN